MSNTENPAEHPVSVVELFERERRKAEIILAREGYTPLEIAEIIAKCQSVNALKKLIGSKYLGVGVTEEEREFGVEVRPNPEYVKAEKEELREFGTSNGDILFHRDAVKQANPPKEYGYIGKSFATDPVPGGLASVFGKPSVDLSGRKAVRMTPAVVLPLHEEAAALLDLVSQLTGGPVVAAVRSLAECHAKRLGEAWAKEQAKTDGEIDAMGEGAMKTSCSVESNNCPLDASMDARRWANAVEVLLPNVWDKSVSFSALAAPFFQRALGAGIAAGKKRERAAMIDELAPVFRNLQILDMWAEKMNVKDAGRGLPLHADPDARRWAREFIATIDKMERETGKKLCDPATFDEDWLLSWFANAMVASYDWAMAKRDREDALKGRQRDAHVYGPLLLTTILQAANAPLIDSCSSRTENGDRFNGVAIRWQFWKRENGHSAPQEAIVIAWKRSAGPGFFARLRARWRLWWDLCPACNSDAPEIDRCEVCNGFRSSAMDEGDMPASMVTARKAVWMLRFMQGKGVRPWFDDTSPEANAARAASDSACSNEEEKADMPDDEARLGY